MTWLSSGPRPSLNLSLLFISKQSACLSHVFWLSNIFHVWFFNCTATIQTQDFACLNCNNNLVILLNFNTYHIIFLKQSFPLFHFSYFLAEKLRSLIAFKVKPKFLSLAFQNNYYLAQNLLFFSWYSFRKAFSWSCHSFFVLLRSFLIHFYISKYYQDPVQILLLFEYYFSWILWQLLCFPTPNPISNLSLIGYLLVVFHGTGTFYLEPLLPLLPLMHAL